VRNGGLFAQTRAILAHIATDLREMHPHGAATYCCGNGGGHAMMPEYRALRLAAGRAKAESMRATDAHAVVVACHNCEGGILETIKEYGLDLKMLLFSEFIAEAVDLSGWTPPEAG
jgi:Fe-S oxidoreductase